MAINLDVNLNIKEFQKATAQIRKESEGVRDALKGIGATAGIAFAGFSGAIAGAVRQASKFQDIGIQFQVLTKDVAAGTKAVKDLQQFAARTPFQFEGIAAAGKNLLAFGFQAEELVPLLEDIGDVAAATGTNFEELGVIFGQVRAAGKLTGERLLQLQERGIPILDQLSKNFGKTTGEIQKLISQGKVSFDDFQKAFADLSKEGGIAFGGLEKRSKTFSGTLSTLQDNFQLLAVQIGEKFIPVLTQLGQGLIQVLQFFQRNESVANFAAALLGVGAAIAGVVTALAAGGFALVQIAEGFAIARVAAATFGITLKGVVGATGIGLLVIAVAAVVENWETVWPFLNDLVEAFAVNAILAFGKISEAIDKALKLDFSGAKESIEEAGSIITTGVGETFAELQAAREQAEVKPEDLLTPDAQKVKEGFEAAREEAGLQRELSAEELRAFQEKEDAEREERFQALLEQDAERKAAFEELDAASKQKLRDELIADLETKEDLRRKAIEKEIKEEVKKQKELAELKKQGKLEQKKIDDFFGQQEITQATSFANQLSGLQRSKNAELKALGKAAAVTQITISTARGAANIFNQAIEAIPFPFNLAVAPVFAAAVTAAGVEQISNVLSAQDGGLITGGGLRGRDNPNILAQLAPGELVVPERNFEEVVNAVAGSRNAERRGEEEETAREGGVEPEELPRANIEISIAENAIDMIEARLIERRNLNVSQELI